MIFSKPHAGKYQRSNAVETERPRVHVARVLVLVHHNARDEHLVERADGHRAVLALCSADYKIKDSVTLAICGVSGVLDQVEIVRVHDLQTIRIYELRELRDHSEKNLVLSLEIGDTRLETSDLLRLAQNSARLHCGVLSRPRFLCGLLLRLLALMVLVD